MSSISQELSNPVLFTLGPGFLGEFQSYSEPCKKAERKFLYRVYHSPEVNCLLVSRATEIFSHLHEVSTERRSLKQFSIFKISQEIVNQQSLWQVIYTFDTSRC